MAVKFKKVSAQNHFIKERKEEILTLIRSCSLKLRTYEVDDYFQDSNEFILAIDQDRIVGLFIGVLHKRQKQLFLGLLLVVVHPDYRGRGLIRRMGFGYFLRCVPKIILHRLRQPFAETYLFSDISNPISYSRMHLGQKIYPDLVRGDDEISREKGRMLRRKLATFLRCHLVDFDTGIVRESAYPERHADTSLQHIDKKWKHKWNEYVPAGADLLVVVPVTFWAVAMHLTEILQSALGI